MKRFLFFFISSMIISAVTSAPGFSWIKLTPRGRVLQKIGHTVILEAPRTPSDITQQIEILKGLKSNNYMHENDIFIFRTGNSKEGGKKLDSPSRTVLDSKMRQAVRAVDEAERLKKSQSSTEASSSVFNLAAPERFKTGVKIGPSREMMNYLLEINRERQNPSKISGISKIFSGSTKQARDNSEVDKLESFLSSHSFEKPETVVEAGISKGNGGPSTELVNDHLKINLERKNPTKIFRITKISSESTEQARDTPVKFSIQIKDTSETDKLGSYTSSHLLGKPETVVKAGTSKENGGPPTKWWRQTPDGVSKISSESPGTVVKAGTSKENDGPPTKWWRQTPDEVSKISSESTKQARDQSEVDKLESFLSSHTFEKPQAGEKAGTSKENTEPKKALSRIDESSGSETERAVDEDGNEILSYVIFHHGRGEISPRSETKPATYENHYANPSDSILHKGGSKEPSEYEHENSIYEAPSDVSHHNKDSKIPSGSDTGESVSDYGQPINQGNQVPASGYLPWDNVLQVPVQKTAKRTGASTKDHGPKKLPEIDEDGYAIPSEVIRSKPAPELFPVPDIPVKSIGNEFITDKNTGDYGVIIRIPKETKSDQ